MTDVKALCDVLRAHPDVRAVTMRPHRGGYLPLVQVSGFATAPELRRHCAQHGVTQPWSMLLHEWDGSSASTSLEDVPEDGVLVSIYEEPATPTEQVIRQVWCDVLDFSPIGVHDDFADAGMDSLAAIEVVTRLCEAFGVQLTMGSLLDAPTVRELAAVVDRETASSQPR